MKIPATFYPQVTRLFEQMDREYDKAAGRSGFVCNGCEDNCCSTRFYHYTLVEYLYLRHGLSGLPGRDLARIVERAGKAADRMAALEQRNERVRVMCPLNEQGRCVLYAHRPMICRLHGIAHVLRRPDGRTISGPGCAEYDRQCGNAKAQVLDRTPIYTAMADLERNLRQSMGFNVKIKMTIAQMIINDGFRV